MKAYTLIEVIVSVLLLAIVLLGGTTLFYQSLKSTGLSDVEANVNNAAQALLRAMEKDIRYYNVKTVDGGTRVECLLGGASGLTGTTLTVLDLNGLETVYSLKDAKVASTSSATGQITYLNSGQVTIESLQFTWYCQAGISDKIKIAIDASSSAMGTGIQVGLNVATEIDLLNSGLN